MGFLRHVSRLAFVFLPAAAFGADGDLSADFGAGSGYVVRDLALGGGGSFNIDLDEFNALALRADDRWIAAGDSCCAGSQGNYLVSRWTATGMPDADFGASGTGYTWGNIASTSQTLHAVVTAPAGHVFAAQYYANTTAGLEGTLLVEFDANGSVAGISATDSGYVDYALVSGEHALPARTLAEGMYFVAGWKIGAGNTQVAHLRGYTETRGTPTGFGSGGAIDVNLSTGYTQGSSSRTDNRFYAAAMQPDGRIVACGYVPYDNDDTDMVVARFTRGGVLDTSFNGSGVKVVAFDAGGVDQDECDAIAVQRDGKIVIAGTVTQASGHAAAVARLTSTGALDMSFGTASSGRVTFAYQGIGASDDIVRGVAIQPNGDIVVAGYIFSGSDTQLATARLLPNGALDASYRGAGGGSYTFTGIAASFANAVSIDHHGQIALAGAARPTTHTTSDQLLVKLRNGDSVFLDSFEDF